MAACMKNVEAFVIVPVMAEYNCPLSVVSSLMQMIGSCLVM